MMPEFIDRTGFEPTAKEYAKIPTAARGSADPPPPS